MSDINKIQANLSEEINEYFPVCAGSAMIYIGAAPIGKAGELFGNTAVQGHERLGLAEFLHFQHDLPEKIIAGDYFYATGINNILKDSGAPAVIDACEAICVSIGGYFSCMCLDDCSRNTKDKAAALLKLVMRGDRENDPEPEESRKTIALRAISHLLSNLKHKCISASDTEECRLEEKAQAYIDMMKRSFEDA